MKIFSFDKFLNEMYHPKPNVVDLSKLKPVEFEDFKFEYISGTYDDLGSVSSCCGCEPRGNGDSDSSDIGICPDCGDHCDYVDSVEKKINGTLSKDGEIMGNMEIVDTTGGGDWTGTEFTVKDGPLQDVDDDKINDTLLELAKLAVNSWEV
jgi:hypothetical protein